MQQQNSNKKGRDPPDDIKDRLCPMISPWSPIKEDLINQNFITSNKPRRVPMLLICQNDFIYPYLINISPIQFSPFFVKLTVTYGKDVSFRLKPSVITF